MFSPGRCILHDYLLCYGIGQQRAIHVLLAERTKRRFLLRRVKREDVGSRELVPDLLIHVDQPVGSHVAVAADTLGEDLLFGDLADLDVVHFDPLFVAVVSDEREVVTIIGTTVVNADGVQVVRGAVELRVCLVDLLLERHYLRVKRIHLGLHLILEEVEKLFRDICVIFVRFLWLLKGIMSVDALGCFIVSTSLFLAELVGESKHLVNPSLRPVE